MIHDRELGKSTFARLRFLKTLMDDGKVRLGGNSKLKIYGLLNCASGKRMNRNNRVFFRSVYEAENMGYRPCGNCMKKAYINWKQNQI